MIIKRRTPKETNAAIRSALFAALAKYSDKQFDRELLQGGESILVDVSVVGHVGDAWVDEVIRGQLQIGHDQTAATSSGPDPARLVAFLLSQFTTKKRLQLLDALITRFTESGELPEVKAATLSAAETLLKNLRSQITRPKKGNLRFEPRPND